MKKDNYLVLQKTFLSLGIFFLSIAAVLILGGAVINRTEIQIDREKVLSDKEGLDTIASELQITQELKLERSFIESLTQDVTQPLVEEKEEVIIMSSDRAQAESDLVEFDEDIIKCILEEREFPFENASNFFGDRENVNVYLNSLDDLADSLEGERDTQEYEEFVRAVKGYAGFIKNYSSLIAYFEQLAEVFDGYLTVVPDSYPASYSVNENDFDNLLSEVKAIEPTNLSEEYHKVLVNDLEALSKHISREPIDGVPEDFCDENSDAVSDADDMIHLDSTSINYPFASFFNKDELVELQDSLDVIEAFVEV